MSYKSAIIHLSDTQFGPENRAEQSCLDELVAEPYVEMINNLADDIKAEAIEKHKVNPGRIGLVVTGDITETGSEGQFMIAKNAIELLLRRLGLPPDQVALVPGNHDVSWDNCKKAYGAKIRDGAGNKEKIKKQMRGSPEKLATFAKFCQDLCGIEFEIQKPTIFKGLADLGIALIGFDTTYPCRWTKRDNYGVLQWEQVRAGGDRLRDLLRDNKALVPIAAVHHSLRPEARGNSQDMSYLREARAVRHLLKNQGFGIVLCGHEHTPNRSSDINGNFKVLVTGSFGLSLKELMKGRENWQRAETNKYELILINPEGCSKILYRRLNTSDYSADAPMGKWEEDLGDGAPSDEVVLWRPQVESTETKGISELPELKLIVPEPIKNLPFGNGGKSWLVTISVQPKGGGLSDIASVIYKVVPTGEEVAGDSNCSFLGDICLDGLEGRSVEAIVKGKRGGVRRIVADIPVP